jgi:hypothetical protein
MTTTQTMVMIRTRSARRRSVRSVRRRKRRSISNTVAVTMTRTMLTGVVQVLVASMKGASLAPVPGPASSSIAGRRARARAVVPSETLVAMAENASTSSSPHMEARNHPATDLVSKNHPATDLVSKNHPATDLASKNPTVEILTLRVVDTNVPRRLQNTALVTCLVVLRRKPKRGLTAAAVTTKTSTAQGSRSMAREDTVAALVADTERKDMDADIRR